MSEASKLIEATEALAGCRWDDPKNPNGLAAVFAAVSREMGQHKHAHKDDVAAGLLLMYQMSPEGQREQAAKEMIAKLLTSGMNPDLLHQLNGGKPRSGR